MLRFKKLAYLGLLGTIAIVSYLWLLRTPISLATNTPELTRFLLVRGTPDHSGMLTFPVDRLTLDNGVLGEQQPLASRQWNARFVRAYHDQGLLLLGSMIARGKFEIKYIWLNNPDEVITIPLDMCNNCGYINAFLLKKANELIFMLVDSGKTGSDSQGYNLQTGEHLALTSADLEFALTLGIPGGDIPSHDKLLGIFVVDKQATFGLHQHIPLNWYLPDDYLPAAKQFSVQVANNQYLRVITNPTLGYHEGNQSYIEYKVHLKQSNQWTAIKLAGQATNLRIFGQWLAAEHMLPVEPPNPAILLNEDKYLNVGGRTYLWRLQPTGLMTLINPITQQHISLQSDNTDIEILLVANEQVFYRIGDSLFQADMVENQLANTKLIVQDPKILDVHWMMAL